MTEHEAPPMPQATAEHQLVQRYVGTWKVDCSFYMDPSQPPMKTEATEVVEPVGAFWTVSRYETDFMGAPFLGRATLGFEPHSGEYVSTWIDSMAPVLCTLRGKLHGNRLELHGEFYSCMTNSVLRHRISEEMISDDEFTFEMYATMPDGAEIKMMRSHYRRA